MYITLEAYPDYEIDTEYPHSIKSKWNDKVISTRSRVRGYIRVYLNRKPYFLHKIIAQQFIPNDDVDNKIYIQHINGVRDDNHIENLKWITEEERDVLYNEGLMNHMFN